MFFNPYILQAHQQEPPPFESLTCQKDRTITLFKRRIILHLKMHIKLYCLKLLYL